MKTLGIQHFFNATWNWHIIKNMPFGFKNGSCVYYGGKDCRCAIGCGLPVKAAKIAEEYGDGIQAVSKIYRFRKEVKLKSTGELTALQWVHDDAARSGGTSATKKELSHIKMHYKECLLDFAKEHNLSVPS